MRITAKADYAVRAMVILAASSDGRPVSADQVATAQAIPLAFLLKIFADLRQSGLVSSFRGHSGGYLLAKDAAEISVADIIRAVEGPLADVRGSAPEEIEYPAPTTGLRDVWLATRVALRRVLEGTSIADIAGGTLPEHIAEALTSPGADRRR